MIMDSCPKCPNRKESFSPYPKSALPTRLLLSNADGGTADAIFHRSDSVSRSTRERSKVSNVLDMFFRGQASAGNAPGRHEYDYIRDLVTRGTTGTLDYQFHQYWMKLLATYTDLKLTMGKDRLPALSGIVQNIMKL